MKPPMTIRYEQALRLAAMRLTGAATPLAHGGAERIRDLIVECYHGLRLAEEALRTELEREEQSPRIGLRSE